MLKSDHRGLSNSEEKLMWVGGGWWLSVDKHHSKSYREMELELLTSYELVNYNESLGETQLESVRAVRARVYPDMR